MHHSHAWLGLQLGKSATGMEVLGFSNIEGGKYDIKARTMLRASAFVIGPLLYGPRFPIHDSLLS